MKKMSMLALSIIFTGLMTSTAVASSVAKQPSTTVVDVAGHSVPVITGGLYDRFRSNPPLSVIATEAPDIDLSWFRGIKKQKTDMGFESYSPNFFYKNSRITAIYTADLKRLKELMPAEVLEHVQPLQVWPSRGLIALTAYAYHYCDNDSYNEIALSIVTNKPGKTNLGPLSLVGQSINKDYWGYVLKLPVNTVLAEVRGVVGYNLPKWLTDINYYQDKQSIAFEIFDSTTGKLDVRFEGKKLDNLSSKSTLVSNSFTNQNQEGKMTYGYALSRQLSHASSMSSEGVHLKLTDGNLSRYIKALKLGNMVRYEYVPEFQSALYASKPLEQLLLK